MIGGYFVNSKEFWNKVTAVAGILCSISAILVLNQFYFISNVIQTVYYVLYVIISSLVLIKLNKDNNKRFSHGLFIPLIILLILPIFINEIIALPLLLVYPLFCSRNSHIVLKIISGLLYGIIIFIFVATVFIRYVFTSQKLMREVNSPNDKYRVAVVGLDQGALGGNTIIKLEKIYFNIIKKEKVINIDRWGKEPNINWIDNRYVEIDGAKIDVKK